MTERDIRIAIAEEARHLTDDATENQKEHIDNLINLAKAYRILIK